jgi:hypothetical protein
LNAPSWESSAHSQHNSIIYLKRVKIYRNFNNTIIKFGIFIGELWKRAAFAANTMSVHKVSEIFPLDRNAIPDFCCSICDAAETGEETGPIASVIIRPIRSL